tara:strand:+ start:1379 stop:1531 length:153 start_codon:yes stop_codon:yes gene_type:complete
MTKQDKIRSIAKKSHLKKNFKPHKMYKNNKSIMVQSFEQHKELMKKGWTH